MDYLWKISFSLFSFWPLIQWKCWCLKQSVLSEEWSSQFCLWEFLESVWELYWILYPFWFLWILTEPQGTEVLKISDIRSWYHFLVKLWKKFSLRNSLSSPSEWVFGTDRKRWGCLWWGSFCKSKREPFRTQSVRWSVRFYPLNTNRGVKISFSSIWFYIRKRETMAEREGFEPPVRVNVQ